MRMMLTWRLHTEVRMMYNILTEKEHKLVFALDNEDPCLAAFIGYVRGDFGKNGDEFWHTWFGHDEGKNGPHFKRQLTSIADDCRKNEQYPVLRDYRSMTEFCYKHQNTRLPENLAERSSAIRIDSHDYVFYIRLNYQRGDYNFRIYCYEKKVLDLLKESEEEA